MTLRLILTRHAKSDWDDPTLDDHDRVLNARGQASATAMGGWLRDRGHLPGQALVSTARRAVETWEGMKPALSGCDVTFHDALYHAAPDTILGVLAQATQPVVLIVGHNPGAAILAESLVRRAPQHARFRSYPTCATLVVDFDVEDWALVLPGLGRCVDFAIPREVIGAA
ncbi:SixA phosphatase family protein [Oceaniglobus trochenteri]|uniref:SixA phosphatase family protein n=1 Tax=Oceaniglobus trochenteri TaxID=2763260 RepID=UPI001CFF555A|nr:histidine phosphatase family protein [Oceaniglobus trochenteri]